MGRVGRVGVRWFVIGGVAVFVLVAASAALAVASGWSIQHTPNPPAQQGSGLDGVSCWSGSACTAVGNSVTDNAHRFLTLAERWNGTRWSIQHTPNPPGAAESYLPGVSCSSASACTAVGNYLRYNGTKTFTLAERWNGTGWSIQRTPNPTRARGSENGLDGVSCWSGSACVAVGSYFNGTNTTLTLAERWNGTGWSIQRTPNPSGAQGNQSVLDGVSCSYGNACTAVGQFLYANGTKSTPLAERWNGTRWSIQRTPNPAGARGNQSVLDGVSCWSGSACTAVGYAGSALKPVMFAERWDGTGWSIQHIPKPTGAYGSVLSDVSCWSGSACTAVGYFFNFDGSKSWTLAERWNGTGWSIQHSPNLPSLPGSSIGLDGVSCWSSSACTALGSYDNGAKSLTLAERWNATPSATTPCNTGIRPVSIKHVVLIVEENHSYNAVIGNSDAKYIDGLASECGLGANFHNTTHPSLPNYVELTSGTRTDGALKSDCSVSSCAQTQNNVFAELDAAKVAWKAYAESATQNCQTSDTMLYAQRHVPAVYYTDIHATSCPTDVVPMTVSSAGGPKVQAGNFYNDVVNGTLPAFSEITPNLCDDGHSTTPGCASNQVAATDRWLAAWVPFILNGPNYASGDTEIAITWDEGEGPGYKAGGSCWAQTTTANVSCWVATILVGPNVTPTESTVAFNHLDLLNRITSILGVPTLSEPASTGTPTGLDLQTTFGW